MTDPLAGTVPLDQALSDIEVREPVIVLSPAAPVASARKFIETSYTSGADRTLHHHASEF